MATNGCPAADFPRYAMEAEPETKVIDRESTTRASSTSVMDALAVGRTVGRYELIHRLGHGGMAAVYLGRATGHAGFEKLVAVKVIHPHLAAEPEFVEMFLDEARIAARIHHPHVVEIHDLGDDGGAFYMVMEYVEGETLASLLRQLRKREERLPLAAALQVLADACGGLAAAHGLVDADDRPMHLVHRDVSPHNLLVGMDGRVKVVDFGIAKATGRRSSTRTGQLRGKLAYMSPEQARSKPVDHRTDLFALGAVAWELLTNERLFVAETESETLARVTACEVPDLRERRGDLPEGVVALVTRALARNPEERYTSAQQMLRDLRALLRELDDEVLPREELARVMSRLFASRVDYIHAAVRRISGSILRSESAANDLVSAEDPTRTSARPSDSHAVMQRRSSSSLPLASMPSTTHTLTSSLATAPARHWTLWLALPLIGAFVGVLMVKTVFADQTSKAAASPAATTPAATTPAATTPAATTPAATTPAETKDPEPPRLSTITLEVNVEPEGSEIYLDGVRQQQRTPASLEVPRSDKEIEVRVSKSGFQSETTTLRPRTSGSVEITKLNPEPPPRRRNRRTAPRGPGKPTSTAPGDSSRVSDTSPREEPTPGSKPDFESYFTGTGTPKAGATGS